MALRLEDKKAIVADVADVASNALSAVAADYRGLTVSEMTQLRKSAREKGVYLRVVRNTLATRALKETDFACMSEILVGPLCLAFSHEEPGAAARVIRDFSKKHEALETKAIVIGGELFDASSLERIANLPSREEALTQLVVVMKAPVTKFVRTLSETNAKLVRTVAAIRDQKQAAS